MTEEGRRLLAAATERPWRWPVGGAIVGAGEEDVAFGEITDVDADLIVAAVNQYAALLDLWEAAIGTVARIDGAQDPTDPALADLLREPLARLRAPSRDSTPDPLE